MFPEGKLAPTDPPPTADTCLQTIRLLDGKLTVYTAGSASAGNKDGGAGVIVTRGDPANPTSLHQSHLRGAAFTHRLRMKQLPCNPRWNGPPPTTPSTHLQFALAASRFSRQLNVGLQ